MKIKNLKFVILKTSLFLVSSIVIGVHSAHAEKLDLSLYPPITEIIATPGSSLSAPITISNNSEKTQKISFSIKPFFNQVPSGTWLRLEKNQQPLDNPFQLRPSETANLSLTTNIPKEASPSDYYSTLIFQTVNEQQPSSLESTAFSKIELGIGTNVLLSIRSNSSNLSNLTNSIIKEFSTNLVFFGQAIKPTLIIENKGLHFVKTKGNIVITDVNGGQIKKITMPIQNILAGTTRNITEEIAAISTQNLFGKYDATGTIEVDGKKTLVTHFTFYAIPKTGVGIITVIMIIIIIVINRLKSYRKIRRLARR